MKAKNITFPILIVIVVLLSVFLLYFSTDLTSVRTKDNKSNVADEGKLCTSNNDCNFVCAVFWEPQILFNNDENNYSVTADGYLQGRCIANRGGAGCFDVLTKQVKYIEGTKTGSGMGMCLD